MDKFKGDCSLCYPGEEKVSGGGIAAGALDESREKEEKNIHSFFFLLVQSSDS